MFTASCRSSGCLVQVLRKNTLWVVRNTIIAGTRNEITEVTKIRLQHTYYDRVGTFWSDHS